MCPVGQKLAQESEAAANKYRTRKKELAERKEDLTPEDKQELKSLESDAAQSADAFNKHRAQCSQCLE
jgi:hypothetical protein